VVEFRAMDGEKIPIAKDMTLVWAEQQEEKRTAFEREQEQKRQNFEQKLEEGKAKRDWMMLFITFAAVAAAYWTGWEAHNSRLESAIWAKDAVSAQFESIQREQRPYVFATPGELKIKVDNGAITAFASFVPVVNGRTPAVAVEVKALCYIFPQYRKGTVDLSAVESHIITAFVKTDSALEPIEYPCQDYDTRMAQFNHPTGLLQIMGDITYHDILTPEKVHHSPFCFDRIIFTINGHTPLKACNALPFKYFD